VLRRSMDFMRDRLGWNASNPGLALAQARLSGDQEVQGVLELLSRAKLIGEDANHAHGLGVLAPATGPADITGNVFDQSFAGQRSESPENSLHEEKKMIPSHLRAKEIRTMDEAMSSLTSLTESSTKIEGHTTLDSLSKALADDPVSRDATPIRPRVQLKRTLTNTDDLTLENRLVETLAQPYSVESALPTDAASAMRRQSAAQGTKSSPIIPATGVPHPAVGHGHGHRWSPVKQAIFTTEVNAPWTITSANDLACLVFGVTNHEIRKLGILEVVKEERRKWLEDKLRDPQAGSMRGNKQNLQTQSTRTSPNSTTALNVGSGLTAKLLSKPASRHISSAAKRRRAQTDDGVGSSATPRGVRSGRGGPNHAPSKSRGVLLCGDVVPIRKRNGSLGSASVWVKEKKGSLIWVLEEILEDVCTVTLDEVGCVVRAEGAVTRIWAIDRLRRGMDIQRLIPAIPKLPGTNTGALDYDAILDTRTFTARTANDMNVPITLSLEDANIGVPKLRVSSFPHIAGIIVLNSKSLVIQSSNVVFLSALFGQENPEGLHVTEILPEFDKLLHLLTDEDKVGLVDGIVIPEHSFRRAKALLSMREGAMTDAAAMMFLRPTGLSAKHRDGAEIMVDVQMRVVKSETRHVVDEEVIEEADESDGQGLGIQFPTTEVVYALWITYSRHIHAAAESNGADVTVGTPKSTSSGIPFQLPAPSPALATDISPPGTSASPSLLSRQLRTNSPTPSDPRRFVASAASAPSSTASSAASTSTASIPVEINTSELTQQESDPPTKKTISDYVVIEEMGQGAYGQVKLCRSKRTGKMSVIKYVTKKRILVDTWTRDRRLGTVPLEIHVLDYLRRDDIDLKHSNIVEMTDFFEDDVNYYIEMKPHGLPGMDLFDYIEIRGNMDEQEARGIFVQVAEAVAHLHIKAKVVHRDIKDENVILDGDKNVKLIDFGSAAYIKNGPFDVFVGTIDYAAPEVLAGMSYRGKEQDVWALGILLYTIIYKENPFYSIDEIMDHDLRVPYVMSEASIDLIRRMLDRDVDRRFSIAEVLAHRWCRGIGAEEEEEGEAGGNVGSDDGERPAIEVEEAE
jgi:protein-serine/threonine kinase